MTPCIGICMMQSIYTHTSGTCMLCVLVFVVLAYTMPCASRLAEQWEEVPTIRAKAKDLELVT